MMIQNNLWVEKYSPKTLSEYVFKDPNQQKTVEGWVADKSIPHLLLYGSAGTGKSTLARVLINDLGVDQMDVLFIAASKENGVDIIRQKISNFSETMPWGAFKIIFMDEVDYLTPEAQGALRNVMDQYASVVRFIMTCNYYNRITEPIRSRCQTFHITNHDPIDFTTRCAEILLDNSVEFNLPILDLYVKAAYPDLRKTLNNLQQNIVNNKLVNPDEDQTGSDWKLGMVQAFQKGNIRAARKIICDNATAEDYDGLYQFLYQNLDMFGKTDEEQDEAIIVIRNGMVKHTQVADPEINLAATLVELTRK